MPTYPPTSPVLSYLSPDRQKLAGRPMLIHPRTGAPLNVVVPAIMISQREVGFDLWAFLPSSPKASSPKSVNVATLEDVARGLHEWFACPERFAFEQMGWDPQDRTEDFRIYGKLEVAGTVTGRLLTTILTPDDIDFSD